MSTRLKIIFQLVFSFVCLSAVSAQAGEYQIVSRDDGSTGITLSIPYSAGVHDGVALSAAGGVKFDPATQIGTGQFIVPIDSLRTGNDKRDCHTREGLGLDYSKSKFPKDHACDNNNRLPSTGNDAIVYPQIQFDLIKVTPVAGPLTLTPGKTEAVQVSGRWTIHNVTKDVQVPATITTLADGRINVKLNETLQLSDFNVVVKPFLFITVKGTVTVKLDLVLKPK